MTTLARLQHVEPYISDLRSQIGFYTGWIPNTYADTVSADNFYEVLRKDMEVKRCSNLLSLMAAGEYFKVNHWHNQIKALSAIVLSNVREFLHARKSLIEKGIVSGLGIQKKYYEETEINGLQGKIQICNEMREVDRRRLRIERRPDNK